MSRSRTRYDEDFNGKPLEKQMTQDLVIKTFLAQNDKITGQKKMTVCGNSIWTGIKIELFITFPMLILITTKLWIVFPK